MKNNLEQLDILLAQAKKTPPPKQPLWSIIYDRLTEISEAKSKGILFSEMANKIGVSSRTFSAALSKARIEKVRIENDIKEHAEQEKTQPEKTQLKHSPIAGSKKFETINLS
ncbi:MAG: hypothetical protein GQ532_11825 [Methylomarinum sp.]|nr:hypothetical protein [Methylomarinum sp.]